MPRTKKDHKRVEIKMATAEFEMLEILCKVESMTRTELIEQLVMNHYIQEFPTIARWAVALKKDLSTLPLILEEGEEASVDEDIKRRVLEALGVNIVEKGDESDVPEGRK